MLSSLHAHETMKFVLGISTVAREVHTVEQRAAIQAAGEQIEIRYLAQG